LFGWAIKQYHKRNILFTLFLYFLKKNVESFLLSHRD